MRWFRTALQRGPHLRGPHLRAPTRAFSGLPWETSYYKLTTEPTDEWLGAKRVESSKVEAIMRRIAQKLFLYDGAERALLEQEIASDEFAYLIQFIDARDAAPRSQPIGQTRLSRELRRILAEDHPSILSEVAHIFWTHQIRRISTYQMVARRLLELGHAQAAQTIMESVLMGQRQGAALQTPAFTLCLELAMANNDGQWFRDLSRRVAAPEAEWRSLQRKFDIDAANPRVALLIAEGYMKFGRAAQLDRAVAAARGRPYYVQLLAVDIEAAHRWGDSERARRAFTEFQRVWDPHRLMSARVLLLATKIAELRQTARAMADKLGPRERRFFLSGRTEYYHPYANPRRAGEGRRASGAEDLGGAGPS